MGGAGLLRRVQGIAWRGEEVQFTPGGSRRYRVKMAIEPFVFAVIERQPTDTAGASEILEISPAGARQLGGAASGALAPALARHLHEHVGLFGYMLLAQAALRAEGDGLAASRPGLPPIRFGLGRGHRLASAEYAIAAPGGGSTIAERVTFSGRISTRGLHWPARLAIARDGAAFATLSIETLKVTLA